MLAWMLYVIMVTLLLSVGAYVAERALRLIRAGTRWIWLAAIAASLCMPFVADSVQSWLPNVVSPGAARQSTVLHQPIVQSMSPASWIAAAAETPAWWSDFDVLLRGLWLGASAVLLLLLTGSFVHLALRMRRWQPAMVAGTPVLVTDEAGPAVVGFLRPRIVLPLWVTRAPRAHQAAVLAHERSHLDARDPQLFTLALALLVFMPWNLPLWWQLRRLRRAIEIDCDARVVESGIDATSYGETLVYVGEHRSAHIGALAATPGSRTFLEQRLRIMLSKPVKWRRAATAALAGTSLCFAALAAQLSPPDVAEAPATRAVAPPADANPDQGRVAIKLPAATLDRYLGDYAQSDSAFVTVKREGDHLLLDFSSGPKSEILAESEDHFFVKGGDARVVFANDGSGKAPSAALWQMGRALPLTRVDAATVAQFKAKLQARMQSQTPAPGTAATLRRLYAGIEAGKPNYEDMQPLLAEALRRDLPKFMASYKQMGPIVSMKFAGVDGGGWDIYEVQRSNGRFRDSIIVGSDGKIAGYLTTQP